MPLPPPLAACMRGERRGRLAAAADGVKANWATAECSTGCGADSGLAISATAACERAVTSSSPAVTPSAPASPGCADGCADSSRCCLCAAPSPAAASLPVIVPAAVPAAVPVVAVWPKKRLLCRPETAPRGAPLRTAAPVRDGGAAPPAWLGGGRELRGFLNGRLDSALLWSSGMEEGLGSPEAGGGSGRKLLGRLLCTKTAGRLLAPLLLAEGSDWRAGAATGQLAAAVNPRDAATALLPAEGGRRAAHGAEGAAGAATGAATGGPLAIARG